MCSIVMYVRKLNELHQDMKFWSHLQARLSSLLAGLLFVTIINYAVAFTAVVLFYVYYTQPDGCTEHKVFISLNLIFCLIVSVVSILPKVQVRL